jgi:hypothetical protein
MRKIKLEKSRLDDKKEDLKKDMLNRLRDEKRIMDKTFNDSLRKKRSDCEEDLEKHKEDVKK